METVMSLGYVKGRYWVTDEVFALYAKRSSYIAFLAALRKAGLAIQCSYSYTARTYHAEVVTYERLQNSANVYVIKHNNSYDTNPLAAMGRAAVESDKATPLIRACVLVMETELLADAYQAALKREAEQARLDAKIGATLDELDDVLTRAHQLVEARAYVPRTLFERMTAMMPVYDEDDDL